MINEIINNILIIENGSVDNNILLLDSNIYSVNNNILIQNNYEITYIKPGTILIGQLIENNAVDENFNPYPNIDSKYGPYNSIYEALTVLPLEVRSIGLTVGIKTSKGITEYWFKQDINNLVKKQNASDVYVDLNEINNKITQLEIKLTNELNNKLNKNIIDIIKNIKSTLPLNEEYLDLIVQYTGETNSTYTNGYFYKCVYNQITDTVLNNILFVNDGNILNNVLNLKNYEYNNGIINNIGAKDDKIKWIRVNVQPITDLTNVYQELDKKVDIIKGKNLSSNDYTDEEREKLANLKNYDDSQLITKITNIEKEVFPLSVTVSGGGIFEKGTEQDITIRWTTKLGNTVITPEAITVNDVSVANTSTSKVFSGVTATTTYTVKVTNNGVIASNSKKATFIAPMYFGFAIASSVNDLSITSLNKQEPIKESPVGTYTINNPIKGYYLWLCVPDSMIINKVVSSEFGVPMEAPAIASTTVDTYKCYRTTAAINAGDMIIEIS